MSIQLFFSSMTIWGERTQKNKHSTMQPATKKARTIRFTEQRTPFVFVFSCCECDAFLPCLYQVLGLHWMLQHADRCHQERPPTQRKSRRKVLPLMAKRATPEEYKKLKKEARRRRQFKGIKDRGQGATLKWF